MGYYVFKLIFDRLSSDKIWSLPKQTKLPREKIQHTTFGTISVHFNENKIASCLKLKKRWPIICELLILDSNSA